MGCMTTPAVSFCLDGFEGVFDGGADPGASTDALALECEVPVLIGEAYGGEAVGDELGGSLGLDRVGVGCVLDGGSGTGAFDGGFAGHDGSAGDAVRGEEDGDAAARLGAGECPGGPESLGEGVGQEWVLGPAGDEVDLEADGCLHDGCAVEAGAGAGVLRGEAEGLDVSDSVGTHLRDDVGDEGVPVAHGDVDAGVGEEVLQEAGLGEGPLGEGRRLGAEGFGEADLGVAVLELFDDLVGKRASSGDLVEVLGHLAEDVGSSVGEEEDCGLAGGFGL